jgi:hypothetical protein
MADSTTRCARSYTPSVSAKLHAFGEREFVTVLAAALVRTDGRQPVGALRATLLATLLGPTRCGTAPSLRTVVCGTECVEAVVMYLRTTASAASRRRWGYAT